MNMATRGTMNANFLFAKNAPPNNAIAAMGVKLGGWGSTRLIAASRMAIAMNRNLGVKNELRVMDDEGRISDFIFLTNFVLQI